MEASIKEAFRYRESGTEPSQHDVLVEEFGQNALNALENAHVDNALLSYFRSYLEQRVMGMMKNIPPGNMTVVRSDYATDDNKILSSIKSLIKSKVPASLTFFDLKNIESYLPKTKITLRKSDVEDIYSPTNVLKEAMLSINSMPLYKDISTYEDLNQRKGDANLFQITYEPSFLKKSGKTTTKTIDRKSVECLNVNWSSSNIYGWLFDGTAVSDSVLLLKAFIKTQFYRPLYFKHDAYNQGKFTSALVKYTCTTRKWYRNHDNVLTELFFLSGDNVNQSTSGLGDVSGKYKVSGINYNPDTNQLKYTLEYIPVNLDSECKFVLDDVQFCAVEIDYGSSVGKKIDNVYFNDFNKEMHSKEDFIAIISKTFVLDGKTYTIVTEGGIVKLKVNATSGKTQDGNAVP